MHARRAPGILDLVAAGSSRARARRVAGRGGMQGSVAGTGAQQAQQARLAGACTASGERKARRRPPVVLQALGDAHVATKCVGLPAPTAIRGRGACVKALDAPPHPRLQLGAHHAHTHTASHTAPPPPVQQLHALNHRPVHAAQPHNVAHAPRTQHGVEAEELCGGGTCGLPCRRQRVSGAWRERPAGQALPQAKRMPSRRPQRALAAPRPSTQRHRRSHARDRRAMRSARAVWQACEKSSSYLQRWVVGWGM